MLPASQIQIMRKGSFRAIGVCLGFGLLMAGALTCAALLMSLFFQAFGGAP